MLTNCHWSGVLVGALWGHLFKNSLLLMRLLQAHWKGQQPITSPQLIQSSTNQDLLEIHVSNPKSRKICKSFPFLLDRFQIALFSIHFRAIVIQKMYMFYSFYLFRFSVVIQPSYFMTTSLPSWLHHGNKDKWFLGGFVLLTCVWYWIHIFSRRNSVFFFSDYKNQSGWERFTQLGWRAKMMHQQ